MSEIFTTTDLSRRHTEVVGAAQHGGARIRVKGGKSLLMLPEDSHALVSELLTWSLNLHRLEKLLASNSEFPVSSMGELAWLRPFDTDDLRDFSNELSDAIELSFADKSIATLEECIHGWRTTATQISDPQRREILQSSLADDYEELSRPE